jgi:hypothetical protein
MVMTQSGDTEAKAQQRGEGRWGAGSAAPAIFRVALAAITRVTYLYGNHSI